MCIILGYDLYIAKKYAKKMGAPVNKYINGINIDLCEDFEMLCLNYLNKRFPNYERNKKNAAVDYFCYKSKLLPQEKYKIFKSDCFNGDLKYNKQLLMFERNAKKGKDLSMYLSKNIDRPHEPDSLLNDWGIYHAHLGDSETSKKFVSRSKHLLLFMKRENNLYFLQVIRHDKTLKSRWTDKDYLRIVKRNWPDLLEDRRLKDIKSTENITSEKLYDMRNAGISTLIEVDGEVYFSPGGGYMSDGTSFVAISNHDCIYNSIRETEKFILKVGYKFFKENYLDNKGILGITIKLCGFSQKFVNLFCPELKILITIFKDNNNNWNIECYSKDGINCTSFDKLS